ncbi:MAG: exosome complex protein Rrp42 [Candidatus Thermoplasmatota archaeon]|jgi:exosome complex component RRP42|nr:exosome complex protein Rrp42 [Candidatus Thermoplasmatota archaeon]MCL5963303.1 exosome complex protein Rrp42 [Candidatus Thermoplasmatota archaeon]
MADEVVTTVIREKILKMIKNEKRLDNRNFNEYRNIEINPGIITSADGSAHVSIGNTSVIAGIKIETGEPFPDTPNAGVMTTNVELIPMASPVFESGPPSPEAVEIARVVDRGIRESKMINMEKLSIVKGEKVWIIYIDLHVIDYDGNLFDTCFIASVVALSTAKFPYKKFNLEESANPSVPVEHFPIESTYVKIGNSIMVDPSLEEETIADARLTIAIDENSDIRAMQKGFSGVFKEDEIYKIIANNREINRSIREIIKGKVEVFR